MRVMISREALTARARMFVEPALTFSTDGDALPPISSLMGELKPSLNGKIQPTAFWRALEQTTVQVMTDLDEARKQYERLLALAGQSPEAILVALDYLRDNSERRGDIPGAMGYARRAVEETERRFGPTSARMCRPLWQVASLFVSAREPDNALDAAMRCLKLVAARGKASLTHASALNNVGVIHHQMGSLPRALEAYESSLVILDGGQVPATSPFGAGSDNALVRVHANLTLVYWQQGDVAQAAKHLQLARVEMAREGGTLLTERGFVDGLAQVSAELDVALTIERAFERLAGFPQTLALPMLLERKGLALDAKTVAVRFLADNPTELRQYRALLAERARLALAAPTAGGDRQKQRQAAAEADLQIRALEAVSRQRTAQMRPSLQKTGYDAALSAETMNRMIALIKAAAANSRDGTPQIDTEKLLAVLHASPRLRSHRSSRST